MYRQLFLEYSSNGKPSNGFICSLSSNINLNEFEKLLNIPFKTFKYYIPLIFNLSTIKKIIIEKFEINENILLFSNRFNIEIGYTNEKIIFNPFIYQIDKLVSISENELFHTINIKQIDITTIMIYFIRQSQVKLDLKSYIIPLETNIQDAYAIIDLFLKNLEYDVIIETTKYYNIIQKLSWDEIIIISNFLKELDWKVFGYLFIKSKILILENNIQDIQNIIFIKDDDEIIISKKNIIFKKLDTLSFLRTQISFLYNQEVIKSKTKITIKDFSLKRNIHPLLKIFMINDPIVSNIKKSLDNNIKVIINKNNMIFFTSGYLDNNIKYYSHFIYCLNADEQKLKRQDKIGHFFISRTCQNLLHKKRYPIITNIMPDNVEKKTNKYYVGELEYYYDNAHYYYCDPNNQHKFLGFLSRFGDECVTCCYLKVQNKKELFQNCILDKKEMQYNPYPLSDKRLISNKNNLKLLPKHIDILFNKNNSIKYIGSRIVATERYVFLSYSDMNNMDNQEIIFNEYIIITNENISLNYDSINLEKILYFKSNNYESFITIKKNENEDRIEIIENDFSNLRSFIYNKLNINIFFKYNEITINNFGLFVNNEKINLNSKYIISIENIYDEKIIKLIKELYKNIIETEDYNLWCYIKYLSIYHSKIFKLNELFIKENLNYLK